MYVKIAVALSIFFVLLISAWFLDTKSKRMYVDNNTNEYEEGFQVQKVNNSVPVSNEYHYFPSFRSREYIRIEQTKENTQSP
ncbi:hypothetical protein LCL95_11635 [Bacillus timonensis]|nr:hypothetical protein [Bacillus timonensis]